MRFSSGAPTTPTTTTSIDLIDGGAQGKRESNSGMMQAPNAPIQVVEVVEHIQQQNGGTSHQEEPKPQPQSQTPVSDKVQPSIVVAITSSPYGGSDGSQTLPDDEGIV
jgi:hypothetical protein